MVWICVIDVSLFVVAAIVCVFCVWPMLFNLVLNDLSGVSII